MKIFDRTTNKEILSKSRSKTTGTDRVIECLLRTKGEPIHNIIFGKLSVGKINWESIPENIVFEECIFNHVTFMFPTKVTFINCEFYKCTFTPFIRDITIRNCKGDLNKVSSEIGHFNDSIIYGVCEFINCSGIKFYGTIDPDSKLIVENSPELNSEIERLEKTKKDIEEHRLKNLELRKFIKYGYKIVDVPVLVKLSFPDEAEIVNLDKDKSRASMARVESVHIINDFGTEGVTNNQYYRCDYKVGEIAYPDSFDKNYKNDCGHGIHFCKDFQDLDKYSCLTYNQMEHIKSIINE